MFVGALDVLNCFQKQVQLRSTDLDKALAFISGVVSSTGFGSPGLTPSAAGGSPFPLPFFLELPLFPLPLPFTFPSGADGSGPAAPSTSAKVGAWS